MKEYLHTMPYSIATSEGMDVNTAIHSMLNRHKAIQVPLTNKNSLFFSLDDTLLRLSGQ